MALERIILNIIPAGDMPVFHCSQYENGRPVIIDLVSSDDDAFMITEGVTVELHCRKCDDTIVTMEPDEVDNNTVTFVTSEQLTACPGDNLCELVLYSDTDPVQTLATLNFILHVEPDPLAGGLTSESEIYNLTQQIEDITHEVIGNDYYNKTEVDGLISDVESQIPTNTSDLTNDSGFITSSDLTPYAKTADLATVATTGDYNDLLNKPTIPDAQIQSDWEQADNTKVDYIKNKPDIDAMIAAALLAVMPVGSSGPDAVASFDTALATDLVDCKTTLAPSLTGYTAVNLTACGVNLWGGETMADAFANEAGYSKNTTTKTFTFKNAPESPYDDIIYDKFKPSTQYTFIFRYTAVGANNSLRIYYTDNTSTAIAFTANGTKTDLVVTSTSGKTISTVKLEYYTNSVVTVYYDESGLFEGVKTVADFTPYTGNAYAIALGDTYHGGTLDVTTGVLTVEYDSSLQPITPYDVQLSPTAVRAIVGMNNVYSDTGDTTVQYKDSIQHYIDTRL